MLARMLHEAGTPAHRLEGLVTSCADRLGLSVSVFSLPTWIHISVGEEGRQRAISFRVDPGSPKLAMLEETYRVADRVAVGELDAEQGITALSRVRGRITRPRPLANCAGYALFSAGAAFFLGGSWAEMFASVPVGLIVGASIALAVGHRERELLAEFGAALIGTELLNQPRQRGTAYLDWRYPLANGLQLTARAEATAQSSEKWSQTTRHKGYTLISAQVGVRGENWAASLYGRNLGDEFVEYYANQVGDPRVIGVSLDFEF